MNKVLYPLHHKPCKNTASKGQKQCSKEEKWQVFA